MLFFILKCELSVVYVAIWGAKQHLMLVYLFVLRRDVNTAPAPAQCTAQGGAAAVGQSLAEVNELIERWWSGHTVRLSLVKSYFWGWGGRKSSILLILFEMGSRPFLSRDRLPLHTSKEFCFFFVLAKTKKNLVFVQPSQIKWVHY